MNKELILKEFGRNLKAERNRAGLSQDGLANLTEICAGKHIGKIERGEINPTLTTVISILQALNIDFQTLYKIKK